MSFVHSSTFSLLHCFCFPHVVSPLSEHVTPSPVVRKPRYRLFQSLALESHLVIVLRMVLSFVFILSLLLVLMIVMIKFRIVIPRSVSLYGLVVVDLLQSLKHNLCF